MSERSASEAIVDALVEGGVTHLFGVPGGGTMEIFKAVHGRENQIRPIVPRDEQTASCMADMYGKLTGKPGVFAAQGAFAGSTGMFGVIEAHLAHSPMVVLTELSEVDRFQLHGPIQSATGNYGSFDLPGIYRNNTKYSFVAHYPNEAVMGVQLAMKHATTGNPGPTAIMFRSNALKGNVDPSAFPELQDTRVYLTPSETCPPAPAVAAAADLLAKAKHPIIIAGNGVRIARAFDGLRTVAETLGAPVVTSFLGKSAIAETHDLALGTMGYTGSHLANEMVGAADVLLVVGCRLKPQETCFANPKMIDPKRQKIIQIDIDARNASWTMPAEVTLIGDARLTLDLLQQNLAPRIDVGGAAGRRKALVALKLAKAAFAHPSMASMATPVYPQRVVAEVNAAAPEDAIICTDAGNNRHWMSHYFRTKRAHSYFGTGGIGGVSWSMAAALTAKVVHPERPAIAVCSDGGFAMQMHVLLTAVQYELAPIYVVMNNSGFGMTAQGMGSRAVGSEFPFTDYAAIARACGCFGEQVTRPGDAQEAIRAAVQRGKPAVIDVVIDADQDMRKEVYSPLATEALAGKAKRVS